MSNPMLLYPIFPAILAGILNYFYWRRKGYTSVGQLIIGIFIFYAVFYGILRVYYSWTH